MKTSQCLLSLCVIMFGISLRAQPQELAGFRGRWEGEENAGLAFELTLQQDGERLLGHHCGMTVDASRIDCSLEGEDEASIVGTVQGAVAKVKFTSAYSGQIGMARLTLQDDSLLWEITAFPNGSYYLPDQAILTRSADQSTRSAQPVDERLDHLHTLVSRELETRAYAYQVLPDPGHVVSDDFNADSLKDMAAVFYAFDESIHDLNSEVRNEDRFLAVGFGTATDVFSLELLAQGIPCLNCGGVYGEPELSLTSENGVLTLASYGGSNWRWEQIQKIRYQDGAFKVIGYTENSYQIGAGLTFGYDLNLSTLEAIRSYTYGENADQQGAVRFRNVMANYAASPITVDGALNEPAWLSAQLTPIRQSSAIVYKPENWSGVSDLSFTSAALWDAGGFYLGLIVDDEQVVPVESWETILHGDHLEVWLDFADALVQWDVEGWPLRQKPTGAVMQFGVGVPDSGAEPVSRILYPERPNTPTGIIAASSRTLTGYILEIYLPLTTFEFLVPAHDEWQWATGLSFGLSLVVSDTDNPGQRRQECLMATSELQWGNPYTFGACYLFETYMLPEFPLQEWRARY